MTNEKRTRYTFPQTGPQPPPVRLPPGLLQQSREAPLPGEAAHQGHIVLAPDSCAPDGREEAGLVQWRLYLAKLIRPDRKLMAQHRRWIGFTLKMVVNSVLGASPVR